MEGLTDQLLTFGLAAVPGLIALVWTWFQEKAKATESQLDDKIVDVVDQVLYQLYDGDEKTDDSTSA